MTRLGIIVLFVWCFVNATIAHAAEQVCDASTLDVLATHLKLKDFYLHDYKTDAGIIVSAACKVAPQDSNIELVAIAYNIEDKVSAQNTTKEKSEVVQEKQVIIVMLDNVTKRIISSYQSAIFEDAAVEVGDNSLLLDTAAYQLAPNIRAFGLRFNNAARGPSCADGWQEDELQLFVREGASLKPIFAVPMSQYLVSQGCVNAGTGMDTIYQEAHLTIKVLASKTHGFFDLMLNAAIKTDGSDSKAKTIKPRSEQILLHYDGKKYVVNKKNVPWWLGSNWALQ